MTALKSIYAKEFHARSRPSARAYYHQLSAPVPLTVGAFAVLIGVYFAVPPDSPARTALYVVPILLALEAVVRTGGLSLRPVLWPATVVFALYSIWMLSQLHIGTKDAFFIGAALFCACVRIRTFKRDLVSLTASAVIVLLILLLKNGTSVKDILSIYGVRSYQGDLESGLDVAMVPVIVAAYRRKWFGMAVIALVLTILFGKREAVAAMLVGVLADLALAATRAGNTPHSRAVLGAAFAATCAVVGLNAVQLYKWVSKILSSSFNLRVPPDYLSSGRYYSLRAFEHYVDTRTGVVTKLLGHGMGYSVGVLETVLGTAVHRHYALLHDDWLRIYSDFGYIGILLVIIGMGYIARFSRENLVFVIYTSILFITDNVFTYFFYWFIAIICLCCERRGSSMSSTLRKQTALPAKASHRDMRLRRLPRHVHEADGTES